MWQHSPEVGLAGVPAKRQPCQPRGTVHTVLFMVWVGYEGGGVKLLVSNPLFAFPFGAYQAPS